MTLKTINPANGQLIKEYSQLSVREITDKISDSMEGFYEWRETSLEERCQLVGKLAQVLQNQSSEISNLMALEMGKPLKRGLAECEKSAAMSLYYAKNAHEFLKDEYIETNAYKSFITYRPLGPILAIMPWNFPVWQVFRCAVSSLLVGNTVLLKHSSNVTGTAYYIEKLFLEAGFPSKVFKYLPIDSSKVNQVIDDPYVKGVALTGSTEAGKAVAQRAGAKLKKTILELGGSDPYIILEDADLEKAAAICVKARMLNTGQTCISAKRFIVIEKVREEFEKLVIQEMQKVSIGDPMNKDIDVGPMVRYDLRDEIHEQVLKSCEQGARLLLGGVIPDGEGAFYPATVLTDVKSGMPAYEEELFGPVASIISAQDENQALRIANDTLFGLGAAIFTRDINKAYEMAKDKLEVGSVFVNEMVVSDPKLPFGGVKESGYGRELGLAGMREFSNIKSICLYK